MLLPGKDDLMFDDTYAVVDCARMVFFCIVFASLCINSACFVHAALQSCSFSLKSVSSLQAPPTLLTQLHPPFCDPVGWPFPPPAAPPHPQAVRAGPRFHIQAGRSRPDSSQHVAAICRGLVAEWVAGHYPSFLS